jgi:CubicO group peptidase (beta-lactamase class C family)
MLILSLLLAAAPAVHTTSRGATFTPPPDWKLAAAGDVVKLDPPETDSHFGVVEAKGADADAAVADAWGRFHAGFKRPLKVKTHKPGRDGWDDRWRYEYEVSPNERAVVLAFAVSHTKAWTVLLIEATEGTFEKRFGQFLITYDTLRPKRYQRETFKGKKAKPLDVEKLKAFVADAQQRLGIPGVGLALIDGGKIAFEGGLGVKELGKTDAVGADTQFMIASNTKGLSTLLLARLVDQGKLDWDTPVTKLYPEFKLGDAETTKQVLVRHLVCACTGLPRQDLEWIFEFKNATAKSELELLGTMKPTSKFGEVFQYSNLLASVAGFVGGHTLFPQAELGQAYDDAMRTQVFEPLGMKHTGFDYKATLAGDHATPHADDPDGKAAVASMAPNYSIYPLRPAGAGWSSAHDLIRYVQMELGKGVLPDGTRYISEKNLLKRREKQVAVGDDTVYGMGLEVDSQYGVPVVHHGGSMFGFKSDMMWLPDANVGAVLLTNSDNGWMVLRPFRRRLQELLYDGKAEAADDVAAAADELRTREKTDRVRLVIPADAAEAKKLSARYKNDALGELTVKQDKGVVRFDLGEWSSAVASRKNDDGTISFITSDPGMVGDFEFVLGEKSLTIRDAQHEYVFTEAPVPAAKK